MADQRARPRQPQGQHGELRGCHTLQRVFTSTHDAEEFKQIFKRMGTYSPGSMPTNPQVLLPGPRGDRSPMPPSQWDAMSAWLASVDMKHSGHALL